MGWEGRGRGSVRTTSYPSGAPGEGHVVTCISSEVTPQNTTVPVPSMSLRILHTLAGRGCTANLEIANTYIHTACIQYVTI